MPITLFQQGNTENNHTDLIRQVLVATGLLLIGVSVLMLLYLAMIAYQVINSPRQVAFIQFLMENARMTDQASYGTMGGQPFDIHLSDPMRMVLFTLVGIWIFGAFAGICSSIMGAGINLIKIAVAGNSLFPKNMDKSEFLALSAKLTPPKSTNT
jgi:hypothetical protein